MPTTQQAIAKKLGISRSTVVQVLNGIGRVSPETRELVLRTAKEMGYRPNPFAQSLKTGKTNTLAFWFYPLLNASSLLLINKLQMLVPPYGLMAMNLGLYKPGWGAVTEEFVPGEWPVDGIFAFSCGYVPPHVLERKAGPPVIWIDYDEMPHEFNAEEVDAVIVKMEQGSQAAVQHLMHTRKRVALFGLEPVIQYADDGRTSAYNAAMQAAGRVPEYISVPMGRPYNLRAKERIIEYVSAKGCPDAIFCSSDEQTPGLHLGLSELGYRVPEDVALVGFDGLPELEYHVPPLSTVVQPFDAIAQTAWKFMQNRLSNPDTPRQYAELQMEFVPRQSS